MWVATGILVALLLQIDVIHGATYSILHPKLFRIDTDEAVVLNLHGYGNSDVSVYAVLSDYPLRNEMFSSKRTNGNAGHPISFNMKVPREKFRDVESISNKKVEMEVHITFQSGGHSKIVAKRIIYLSGESDCIFVQTDRPIYKPGDTVKIRVMPLHNNMLPMRERQNLFEIVIKTAEGVGIWKKIRSFPSNEFVIAEYKIPEGPPLGVYYVEAKLQSKTHTSTGSTQFKIDKYVLPTYHVKIDIDQTTVKPDGEITGSFKAEYSYGEPVVGTYAISATLHVPEKEPMEIYAKPQNPRKRAGKLRENDSGVAALRIPTRKATEVSNMTWIELIESEASITVVVSVMGKAEGILESDSMGGILLTNTPYLIDTSHSSKYFIPSLTTFLNVRIRNVATKEPVPGVHAVASIDGTPLDGRQISDDRGFFTIPVDTTSNSNQIRVMISTDDERLALGDQAQTTFVLERHQSNNGYLSMESPNTANVGDIYVRFRTQGYRPSTIYYLVISKGGILSSGAVSVSQDVVSQQIEITRKMSPNIRIVGYFMNGNNVVSDSVWIDVDDVCSSRELAITVEPEEIRPGEQVQISYQGEPRSMIGTSAVDRAAYYLFEKGRLDRHKMFQMMESFDMGCSISGGSTPINVFEEAGLAFSSGSVSTAQKLSMDCPQEGDNRRKKRSLLDLIQGLDVERRIWIKKCYSDGRRENLAGEQCDVRKQRCDRLEIHDKVRCIQAFYDGCIYGEKLRNSSQFKQSTQRATGIAMLDRQSHPSNTRRQNFEEGWLWYTLHLDNHGQESHSPSPPHSMTTYDIDAVGVSDQEGFCIAKPAELKVFKDFFIQLYLPYSVKVMEQVQIRAALFNYHPTKSREMRLRIKVDEKLCTEGIPGEWSTMVERMTVESQSSMPFVFSVIPLSVPYGGFADIEVEAIPLQRLDHRAADSIQRKLRIEPTGSEETFSESFQLDPSLSQPDRQITLNFPDEDIVPDSKSCSIFGFMSYLGPIIEFDPIAETPKNLDKSISLPGGCGEQNMKRVGPNVFAFKYLKYVGDPTPDTQAQVQKYIIDGYTRQQSHRNNGRWSIWSSASPTIWINAYVDKVFLHAREVWLDMDIGPICQSLRWIGQQQRSDGSFSEQAHSRHYWINVAEGGEVALTAYVLITLLEKDSRCQDNGLIEQLKQVQWRAQTYLQGTVGQSTIPYTAAIVAYALALADPRHESTSIANQRLMDMQSQNGDETFWRGPNVARKHVPTWHKRKQAPIDIETTAYALLTQVAIGRSQGSSLLPSFVERTNGIARWMVSQQNDRGGFQSSQTTVIAIQSMTEYAQWIHAVTPPPRDPHLRMILTAPQTPWENGESFNLDKNNEFYRKELRIPREVMDVKRDISVTVTGEGRGTLSYRCTYRTTRNSEVCDFNIIATTQRVGYFQDDGESEAAPGEGKEVIKLVLEISKISEGDSGMAIIDVSLISGFKPVESSLEAITIAGALDGVLDNYEVNDQSVVLYVERIQHEEALRLGFNLQQTVSVKGASPAKIVVYDYYKPEDTCTKFYSLPGGSPQLRTSCAPTSIDSSSERMCKCMEGGCPTCRTREEQLDKTCGRRYVKCSGCRGEQCLNLHHSVCARDYGLIIEITKIDKESMPQFIKMTARVDEVIRRTSDDELVRDAFRTFVIRKDCFDKCADVSLRSLVETDYFTEGRVFLIRGKKGISHPTSDGNTRIDYFLDKETIVERTLTAEKCARFERRRKKCNRADQAQNPKCISVREKLELCDKQNAMRAGINEGCDL